MGKFLKEGAPSCLNRALGMAEPVRPHFSHREKKDYKTMPLKG